jgi:hypothetical protein
MGWGFGIIWFRVRSFFRINNERGDSYLQFLLNGRINVYFGRIVFRIGRIKSEIERINTHIGRNKFENGRIIVLLDSSKFNPQGKQACFMVNML